MFAISIPSNFEVKLFAQKSEGIRSCGLDGSSSLLELSELSLAIAASRRGPKSNMPTRSSRDATAPSSGERKKTRIRSEYSASFRRRLTFQEDKVGPKLCIRGD